MREAIGGAWLYGIVITFIVFFASFLAVSVNYSKAFHVKNNIVDLLSKYEGNNPCARKKISNYLKETGYMVPYKCSSINDGYTYKGYNLNGDEIDSGASEDSNVYSNYCIYTDSNISSVIDKDFYRVVVFFRIDLPFMGDLFTFKVRGETETIYYVNETTTC